MGICRSMIPSGLMVAREAQALLKNADTFLVDVPA
jgi:hypothetical protein